MRNSGEKGIENKSRLSIRTREPEEKRASRTAGKERERKEMIRKEGTKRSGQDVKVRIQLQVERERNEEERERSGRSGE